MPYWGGGIGSQQGFRGHKGVSGAGRGVGGVRGQWELHMKNDDNLLQIAKDSCKTQGTSELRSTWPMLVPFLATRCLYQVGMSELRSPGPM